jgi:biotin carboxyl carrier protein
MMDSYRITLDGITYEVEVLSDPTASEVQVRVNGEIFEIQVSDLKKGHATVSPTPLPSGAPPPVPSVSPPVAPAANGAQLISPLPGTVISVAVEEGQHVEAGDELIVIEAMKMNNRIRSPRSGTVGKILVQVGQQVSHGAPLLAWSDSQRPTRHRQSG